jgi:hypothetical protein
MTQVPLENLTGCQRQAYILRFRRGWRLWRIAAEVGIIVSRVVDGVGSAARS